MLKDSKGNYFLRATVSSDVYKDYNIAVSVFIALISLHKNMKETDTVYFISRCEYSESHIKVFFEKNEEKEIKNLCSVKHLIELTNSEIKRSALEFSGVASIQYRSGDEIREIYIKPESVDFTIASVYHSHTPKTAVSRLELTNKITAIENALYDDISFISEIKEPDQIRHLLQKRVTKDTNLSPFITGAISKELDDQITTMHQLFEIMHKVDLVISDIDSKEYFRYLLYSMIKEEKTRRDKEKDDKKKRKGL